MLVVGGRRPWQAARSVEHRIEVHRVHCLVVPRNRYVVFIPDERPDMKAMGAWGAKLRDEAVGAVPLGAPSLVSAPAEVGQEIFPVILPRVDVAVPGSLALNTEGPSRGPGTGRVVGLGT